MPRLDGLLLGAFAALAGGVWVCAPVATACALIVCLALLGVPRRSVGWLVLLFAIGAWRAAHEVSSYESAHWQMRNRIAAPQRCQVRGRVESSPTWRGDSLSFLARLQSAECETATIAPGDLVRLYGGPRQLARGDQFEGIAQLGIRRLFRNEGLPNPYVAAARTGVLLSGGLMALDVTEPSSSPLAWIDAMRASVRDRIEATFAPTARGMAKALVLGENDLTDEEDDAFKSSGLAHLLAVSGTHLVFAVLSIVGALRFTLVRWSWLAETLDARRLAYAFGAALALLYADFAGGSGSARRAAWMLCVGLAVRAMDREANVWRAVAASVFIGWLLEPLVVTDFSFMLSLAATLGLLSLGQAWTAKLEQFALPKSLRTVALGVVATVSSMLPCSLLLSLLSPQLSLLGVVANVFAGPFGETIALPLCLGHALLAPLPTLEQGVATVASGALLVVREAALFTAQQHWLDVEIPPSTGWQFGVLAAGLCGALGCARLASNVSRSVVRRCTVIATIAGWSGLEVANFRVGHPHETLRVTVLDVGQGDAILVDLPDGRLMLIDGGGFVESPLDLGERVLLPVLRARRRSRIDIMVLSHPHPDHFGGLLSVVSAMEVGEFWDTGQGQSEGAGPTYATLLSELHARDVPIRGPVQLCGHRGEGSAPIQVLGPCPQFTPGAPANDNSFVLRIGFKQHHVLLTGDAEREQEEHLLASGADLSADLLKAGHHGSRTSTTDAFLKAVSPSVAGISSGMRNRFGHPHAVTLERLRAAQVSWLRTDLYGSLTWFTNGSSWKARTAIPFKLAPEKGGR